MPRQNIVQPSLKSRSTSVKVDGSVQGASWQMCVKVSFNLEALVFEKRSVMHKLKIVNVDNIKAAGRKIIPISLLLAKGVVTNMLAKANRGSLMQILSLSHVLFSIKKVLRFYLFLHKNVLWLLIRNTSARCF